MLICIHLAGMGVRSGRGDGQGDRDPYMQYNFYTKVSAFYVEVIRKKSVFWLTELFMDVFIFLQS